MCTPAISLDCRGRIRGIGATCTARKDKAGRPEPHSRQDHLVSAFGSDLARVEDRVQAEMLALQLLAARAHMAGSRCRSRSTAGGAKQLANAEAARCAGRIRKKPRATVPSIVKSILPVLPPPSQRRDSGRRTHERCRAETVFRSTSGGSDVAVFPGLRRISWKALNHLRCASAVLRCTSAVFVSFGEAPGSSAISVADGI